MSNIDEHIRKAIEDGQFDNLPGKGKPIQWQENPYEDPEWRLAYKMLKDGGFSLPWIETRREIEETLERLLADLARSWAWRNKELSLNRPYPQVQAEWERAVEIFQKNVAELNKNILNYNLKTPSASFQRTAVNPEKEIERITQSS